MQMFWVFLETIFTVDMLPSFEKIALERFSRLLYKLCLLDICKILYAIQIKDFFLYALCVKNLWITFGYNY